MPVYDAAMRGRAVIVHTLAHCRAALAAAAALGVKVTLLSAPGAASYLGGGYWKAMIDEARSDCPGADALAVLDCGEHAGHALAALRQGVEAVRFHGKPEAADRIADIARKSGAALVERTPRALDLLDEPDPEAACRDWLEG